MLKTIDEILNDVKNHKFIKFLYDNKKKLVLYGAGDYCYRLLQQALRYNLPINYIIDGNPEKKGIYIQGIEVKHIDDIVQEINQYKFIITTIYVYPIVKLLHSHQISDKDIYVPDKYDIYTGTASGFQYFHAYLSPIDVYLNREHYLKAYDLLCEEKSKKIFRAILQYRLYGIYCQDFDLYNNDESYFNNTHTTLGTEEVFVDIGALEGDSIIGFIRKCNNTYKKIYAIEANQISCEKLKKNIIDERNKNNIEILNIGVGKKRETISYDGFIGKLGSQKLEIYPLDEILKDKCITIIKMDIEGMELESIKGAVNTIKTQKPVLAICIYHLVTDLWEIIETLHDILPEYQFCLEQPFHRHLTETVLYAFIDR